MFLQSQDGSAKLPGYLPPAEKDCGLASHRGGGYVLPRLSESRWGENESVSVPAGANWRR